MNHTIKSIQIWSAAACHRFRKREQAHALQKLLTVNRVSTHGKNCEANKFPLCKRGKSGAKGDFWN